MTDAGKRLRGQIAYHIDPSNYLPGDYVSWADEDIAAIEAEAVASMVTQQESEDMARLAVAAERQRIKAAVEGLRDTGLNVSVVDTTGVTRRGRIQEFVWRSAVLAIIDGEAT